MEDVLVDPLPNLQLPQWEFLLKQSTEITRNKDEIRNQLMEAIKKESIRVLCR